MDNVNGTTGSNRTSHSRSDSDASTIDSMELSDVSTENESNALSSRSATQSLFGEATRSMAQEDDDTEGSDDIENSILGLVNAEAALQNALGSSPQDAAHAIAGTAREAGATSGMVGVYVFRYLTPYANRDVISFDTHLHITGQQIAVSLVALFARDDVQGNETQERITYAISYFSQVLDLPQRTTQSVLSVIADTFNNARQGHQINLNAMLENVTPPSLPDSVRDIAADALDDLREEVLKLGITDSNYTNLCNALVGLPSVAGEEQERPTTADGVIAAFTHIFPEPPEQTQAQKDFLTELKQRFE